MPNYVVSARAVDTGAVVGTFKTLLSLLAADTLGHRCRLRWLQIGFGGEAAQDVNVDLRIARNAVANDGTGTAVTPEEEDAAALATVITSKKNYTAEPSSIPTVFAWEGSVNSRGSLFIHWPQGQGPQMNRSEMLQLLASPGAAVAVKMNVAIGFEQF